MRFDHLTIHALGLEHEADIRNALTQLEAARAESATAERASQDLAHLAATALTEHAYARGTMQDRERRVAEAERATQDARARWERHRDAHAHAEALTVLEAGLRDVEARAEAAERALAELQAAQAGRSATRIADLREALEEIETSESPVIDGETARSALAEDDAQAAREASYPADLLAAQAAVRDGRSQVATARRARDEVARQAAAVDPNSADALRAAGERLDAARTELGAARTSQEERARVAEEAAAAAKAAQTDLRRVQERAAEAARVVARWPAGVEQLLDAARARMEELEPQAVAALAHAEAIEARFAALPAVGDLPDLPTAGQPGSHRIVSALRAIEAWIREGGAL